MNKKNNEFETGKNSDVQENGDINNAIVILPLSVFAVAVTYMKNRPYGEVAPIINIMERSRVVDLSDIEKTLYELAFENIKKKTSDIVSSFSGNEVFNIINDEIAKHENQQAHVVDGDQLVDCSDNSLLASEDEVMGVSNVLNQNQNQI